jgi:MFS family permease
MTASAVAVAFFSLSLALAGVAVPILILEAGYSVSEVGFFIALSGVAQIAARIRIGALMRRLPDKHLVGLAGVLMGLGSGLLAASAALVSILVSQLLQGAARGFFWTAIQTHAVRTSAVATRGLALVNLASGVGLIVGPAVAGLLLEISARVALSATALVGFATLVPVLFMARLAAFPERPAGQPRVWTKRGVRSGAFVAASAGAWRGLMGTYVPTVLHQAAHSSVVIGVAVSLANIATVVAGWRARSVRQDRFRQWLVGGAAVAGLGLAVFGLAAEFIAVAVLALALSGLGIGLVQTVGPASAAEAVDEDERGDAMAALGLSRATATFAAPFGVAALVSVLPLGHALVAAGGLVALPAARGMNPRRPC